MCHRGDLELGSCVSQGPSEARTSLVMLPTQRLILEFRGNAGGDHRDVVS